MLLGPEEVLRSRVFFLAKCGNLLNSNLSIDPSVGNALPDNCLMLRYLLERWKLERGPTATLRLRNKVHTSWLGSWRLAPNNYLLTDQSFWGWLTVFLPRKSPPTQSAYVGEWKAFSWAYEAGMCSFKREWKCLSSSIMTLGRAKIPNVCLNPCICLFLIVKNSVDSSQFAIFYATVVYLFQP